jgi:predicted neuraminidase
VLADDAARQPDGRGTEFSYPAIREPRPGVLALTFTWNRRQIRFIELALQ